jgi:PAS domain S-box-containing protein
VVDDEPVIHEEIRKILEASRESGLAVRQAKVELFNKSAAQDNRGAGRVDSAFHGEEGLTRVREALVGDDAYDLAFVDQRMLPGWDGLETISRIWQIQPDLQIVLCAAHGELAWEQLVRHVSQPERFSILRKPFEPSDILQHAASSAARKRTEEVLRESEERFRNLAAATFEGICISENGVVIEVNDRFLEIYGCWRSDVVGKKIVDLIPPESRAIVAESIRTNRGAAYEHKSRHKDGHIIEVETRAKVANWAGRHLRVAAVRDITARKRADQTLRRIADRLQVFSEVVEQCPTAVLITDPAGCIWYVNRKFVEASGYSSAEVLGQNARMLRSGTMPAGVYEELWRTIRAGASWRGELCHRKKSGELYWESTFIWPVKDDEGNITHFLGIKEDIAEPKMALNPGAR